jgi:hypothetical protein
LQKKLLMLRAIFFLTCFCLSVLLLPAQGPLDGYLKGKGVLDLVPSLSFNSASKFDGAGGQVFDEKYKGQMLSIFAEYGLSERFDLVATGAYVFTQKQSGLQDGGLFAKYRPVYTPMGGAGKLGILLGTGIQFPLSDYEPVSTGALGQKAVSVPARLIAQWETPVGLFINLTGGYNWRIDDLKAGDIAAVRVERPDYQPVSPPDFVTVLLKAGFPAARYYVDVWVEWQHTSGGADYAPKVPDLPQAYGVSYTQTGGTLYYSEGGKNGIFLSGAYILGGRNVSRILRLTAGFVVKI